MLILKCVHTHTCIRTHIHIYKKRGMAERDCGNGVLIPLLKLDWRILIRQVLSLNLSPRHDRCLGDRRVRLSRSFLPPEWSDESIFFSLDSEPVGGNTKNCRNGMLQSHCWNSTHWMCGKTYMHVYIHTYAPTYFCTYICTQVGPGGQGLREWRAPVIVKTRSKNVHQNWKCIQEPPQ
jgi:hypothetical protein